MKTSGNNENRIVNEFLRLASIDSLSLKEREMADAIKDILKELEIVYSEDDAAEIARAFYDLYLQQAPWVFKHSDFSKGIRRHELCAGG